MELQIINDKPVVTSLQVAEDFEKRHNHILRDIEKLQKDVPNFGEMFAETNIPDNYGRDRKGYLLTRDAFTLLAMGFTGNKALNFKLAYIEAFNKMENHIKDKQPKVPANYSEALRLAADLVEKTQKLEKRNKEVTEVLLAFQKGEDSWIVRQFVKYVYDEKGITIKEQEMLNYLRKNYFDKYGLPLAQYKKYFAVKRVHKNGKERKPTIALTQKGVNYFTHKLLQGDNTHLN